MVSSKIRTKARLSSLIGALRIPHLCVGILVAIGFGCAETPTIPKVEKKFGSIGLNSAIQSIDFANDSLHLAALGHNGRLYVLDVLTGESVREVTIWSETDGTLELASQDRFAVVADNQIQIWNLPDGCETRIPQPRGSVPFLKFDRKIDRIAIPGDDGTIGVWSVASGLNLKTVLPLDPGASLVPGPGFGVTYLPGDRRMRVLDLNGEGAGDTFEFERDPGVEIAYARDREVMATMNREGSIEIRVFPGGTIDTTIQGFKARPRVMALSPDASLLAVDSAGGIDLWEVSTGKHIAHHESTVAVERGIHFSPDGHFLAWIEKSREQIGVWCPVEGIVQWEDHSPTLREDARPVCSNLATTVRFKNATQTFELGREFMNSNDLASAKKEFVNTREVFPNYPGLYAALSELEARTRKRERAEQIIAKAAEFESAGNYHEALRMLEGYVRDFNPSEDNERRDRARTLSTMLASFEQAERHRKAGETMESVVAFENAANFVPKLRTYHPEYAVMLDTLLAELKVEAEHAYAARRYRRLLEIHDFVDRFADPESGVLLRRGEAHEAVGEREKARQSYSAVPADDPDYSEARWRLARMARWDGDPVGARSELERARKARPNHASMETEFAEICTLVDDLDEAVQAWGRVAKLEPTTPRPYEEIGKIEEKRNNWAAVGNAYVAAIERSSETRLDLTLDAARAFDRAGKPTEALEVYVELFELVKNEPSVPGIGDNPRQKVYQWIRELGFILHRGTWIPRDQFLTEQGWVKHDGEWIRPEEAKLRAVVKRFQKSNDKLRSLPAERYQADVQERRICKGMTRREVIEAWGFFEDQNTIEIASEGGPRVVYEQLLYPNMRQVYMRDGEVCFWSE